MQSIPCKCTSLVCVRVVPPTGRCQRRFPLLSQIASNHVSGIPGLATSNMEAVEALWQHRVRVHGFSVLVLAHATVNSCVNRPLRLDAHWVRESTSQVSQNFVQVESSVCTALGTHKRHLGALNAKGECLSR